VKYKTVLLGRHDAMNDHREDPSPLTYIGIRNQEALRAWRERAAQGSGAAPLRKTTERRRSWLASFGWADSAGSLLR
jgi:hypothetical protein